MKTESELLSSEEIIQKFAKDRDVMAFGGATAIDFETCSEKIKGNLTSRVKGGKWRS